MAAPFSLSDAPVGNGQYVFSVQCGGRSLFEVVYPTAHAAALNWTKLESALEEFAAALDGAVAIRQGKNSVEIE